jgi:hypothetical protein
MKSPRLVSSICVLSFMLGGCSVQSSQLSSIINLMRGSPVDYSESAWLIRYGEYRAQVQALSFEGGILFSNSRGDQAFFDGWTITRAAGLGLERGSWSVKDDAGRRHFTHRSRLSSYPACAPWEKEAMSGVVQFTQSCQGASVYRNKILVNKKGQITLIRQSLNAGASFVTLSKLQKD